MYRTGNSASGSRGNNRQIANHAAQREHNQVARFHGALKPGGQNQSP
jgi:hypothetical protein